VESGIALEKSVDPNCPGWMLGITNFFSETEAGELRDLVHQCVQKDPKTMTYFEQGKNLEDINQITQKNKEKRPISLFLVGESGKGKTFLIQKMLGIRDQYSINSTDNEFGETFICKKIAPLPGSKRVIVTVFFFSKERLQKIVLDLVEAEPNMKKNYLEMFCCKEIANSTELDFADLEFKIEETKEFSIDDSNGVATFINRYRDVPNAAYVKIGIPQSSLTAHFHPNVAIWDTPGFPDIKHPRMEKITMQVIAEHADIVAFIVRDRAATGIELQLRILEPSLLNDQDPVQVIILKNEDQKKPYDMSKLHVVENTTENNNRSINGCTVLEDSLRKFIFNSPFDKLSPGRVEKLFIDLQSTAFYLRVYHTDSKALNPLKTYVDISFKIRTHRSLWKIVRPAKAIWILAKARTELFQAEHSPQKNKHSEATKLKKLPDLEEKINKEIAKAIEKIGEDEDGLRDKVFGAAKLLDFEIRSIALCSCFSFLSFLILDTEVDPEEIEAKVTEALKSEQLEDDENFHLNDVDTVSSLEKLALQAIPSSYNPNVEPPLDTNEISLERFLKDAVGYCNSQILKTAYDGFFAEVQTVKRVPSSNTCLSDLKSLLEKHVAKYSLIFTPNRIWTSFEVPPILPAPMPFEDVDTKSVIDKLKSTLTAQGKSTEEIKVIARELEKKYLIQKSHNLTPSPTPETVRFNCLFDVDGEEKNEEKDLLQTVFVQTTEEVEETKLIRIEFAGDRNTDKAGSEFKVNFYKGCLKAVIFFLQGFGGDSGDKRDSLYPIFIISKDRYHTDEPGFLAHIPIYLEPDDKDAFHNSFQSNPQRGKKTEYIRREPWNTLEEQTPALIFLLVEEQERELYQKMIQRFKLDKNESQTLILVSIPGKNRGIGFARTMVMLLQRTIEAKIPIRFPFFYLLDDNIHQFRIFNLHTSQMEPCTATVALAFLQQAFEDHIKGADLTPKFLNSFSSNSRPQEEPLKALFTQLKGEFRKCVPDLLDEDDIADKLRTLDRDQQRAILDEFRRGEKSFAEGLSKLKFFLELKGSSSLPGSNPPSPASDPYAKFLKCLWTTLSAITKKTTERVPLFSLTPSKDTPGALKKLLSQAATHSINRIHRTAILFYSPAVRGFSYFSHLPPHFPQKHQSLNHLSKDLVLKYIKSLDPNHQYLLKSKKNQRRPQFEKVLTDLLESNKKFGEPVPHGLVIDALFAAQNLVDTWTKSPTFLSDTKYGFTQNEEFFIQILMEQGRYGFQVHYFEAIVAEKSSGGFAIKK